MSYLNYLSFEITMIISSALFMIGKVIELVYGIIVMRSKAKNDDTISNSFKSMAEIWIRKTSLYSETSVDDDEDETGL